MTLKEKSNSGRRVAAALKSNAVFKDTRIFINSNRYLPLF